MQMNSREFCNMVTTSLCTENYRRYIIESILAYGNLIFIFFKENNKIGY